MKLFELGQPSEEPRHEIDAEQRWSLPGVHCPACGNKWASVGPCYPHVLFSGTSLDRPLRKPRNVPLAEFEALAKEVRALVPGLGPLPPGTRFGPLSDAVIRGTVPDVVWPIGWSIVLREDALYALVRAGVKVAGAAPVEARPSKRAAPALVEPFAPLAGELAVGEGGVERSEPDCTRCGRRPLTRTSRLAPPVIDGSTVPLDTDLFRLSNFPTLLVVTGRFANAAREAGLTGVKFREVQVSS